MNYLQYLQEGGKKATWYILPDPENKNRDLNYRSTIERSINNWINNRINKNVKDNSKKSAVEDNQVPSNYPIIAFSTEMGSYNSTRDKYPKYRGWAMLRGNFTTPIKKP